MSENVGNDAKSTLHTGVDSTITSWVVDNPLTGPAYPAVNFRVRLGTAATGELVLVTAVTDNGNGTSNWTVQRGVESTANQAWIAGTVIEHVLTAAALSLIATQIAAAAVAAAPVSGLVDYYLNTPPPVHITGYENLGRQPGIGSAVDESVACIGGGSNTWGTPVLIDKYATRIGDPGEAAHIVGSWEFFFFGYASSVTKDVRLVYEVYRRTAAGVESLIFTKNSSFILSTSAVAPTALADIYVQSASVLFASDDTITLYVYAQTNSNSSVTVHYFHNDGAYASYVQTPMTTSVPHPQYINVTQTAHGFTNGQAIYFTGAAWALADASNAGKLAVCLVGDKTTDTFNAYYAGPITIATGTYTPGHFYFVDPATPGALTTTDPLTSGTVGQFSNPIFHALGATYGFVLPYRPAAVQASLWPGTSASLVAGDGSNVASARTKLDEVAATTITSLTAATTTAYGTSKLSVAPASATAPIAVGDNDGRLSSRIVNGGRLTLTTGVPVTTSDVATATSVYWTPYLHGSITLWSGTVRQTIVSAEVSVALGTITTLRPYDVFGYLSGGALVLEILAWTSDTARATALSYQNGMLCKTGDATRRYLGTFRTISTTQTTDTLKQRFLWNMDNRVPRELAVFDTTASWTWASATGYRQANNAATNKVELLLGLSETPVIADATLFCGMPTTAQTVATAIGLDSTTAAAGDQIGGGTWGPVSGFCTAHAHYRGIPALGYHYLAWLEGRNVSTGTMTFYGAQGAPNMISSGLVGVTVQ